MKRAQHDAEFSAYVEERRRHLLRTAYLLCGDWHRAEDLLQQALVRLYRAWPRLSGGHDSYARKALMSCRTDDWRRRDRRPETPVAEHADRSGTSWGQAGLGAASTSAEETTDHRDQLRWALQQLPEGRRKVIVLRYWLDLSVEETAHDLGITTGTVKSQTSKALASLRELLQDDLIPVIAGEAS